MRPQSCTSSLLPYCTCTWKNKRLFQKICYVCHYDLLFQTIEITRSKTNVLVTWCWRAVQANIFTWSFWISSFKSCLFPDQTNGLKTLGPLLFSTKVETGGIVLGMSPYCTIQISFLYLSPSISKLCWFFCKYTKYIYGSSS